MFLLYFQIGCPYSINALNLLSDYHLDFLKVDINDQIRKQLVNEYNHYTMPAIFYYDKNIDITSLSASSMIPVKLSFIGGYDKLLKLFNILSSLKSDNIKKVWNEYNNSNKMDYKTFLKIAIEFNTLLAHGTP